MTKWIFLESTQKGLSKNVREGISTPLGYRDIIQTQRETFFWDTLYVAGLYFAARPFKPGKGGSSIPTSIFWHFGPFYAPLYQ